MYPCNSQAAAQAHVLIEAFDDVGALDHFLSLKLLNSMIHPLCLFIRTVNIINNLRWLELNVEFRWQKNAKLSKIDEHNACVSIISLLIEVLLPDRMEGVEKGGGQSELKLMNAKIE